MCLARPSRGAYHAAEILGPERGILVGENIGVDSAEGRLGLVVEAVVEGLDDLFLEAAGARVRADNDFEMTNAKSFFSKEDFAKLYPETQDSVDPVIPKGTRFLPPAKIGRAHV